MATSWTDDPLVVGVTAIKAVHMNELRTAMNAERARRGYGALAWTDDPTSSSVQIKKTHVDEMRAGENGPWCASNFVWTNDPLVATVTPIKAQHIAELRTDLNTLENTCLCNCNGHCACNCNPGCNHLSCNLGNEMDEVEDV